MTYTIQQTNQVVRDSTIHQFEQTIANFYGATYGIAVDSCTHAMELCMRFEKYDFVEVPTNTYISVPLIMKKIGIRQWRWEDNQWEKYYYIGSTNIVDAAVCFEKNSYIPGTYFCLSFLQRKHLPLGRGGMILTDNPTAYYVLKRMSCDGRDFYRPWRDQDIDIMGYHYYMTPEVAEMGMKKLPDAIKTKPRQWIVSDWPDLTQMEIFK